MKALCEKSRDRFSTNEGKHAIVIVVNYDNTMKKTAEYVASSTKHIATSASTCSTNHRAKSGSASSTEHVAHSDSTSIPALVSKSRLKYYKTWSH